MWQRKMKDMHKNILETLLIEMWNTTIFLFLILQSTVAVAVAGLWNGCFST